MTLVDSVWLARVPLADSTLAFVVVSFFSKGRIDDNERVRFLAINTSWGRTETPDRVKQFWDKAGYTLEVLYDTEGKTTRRFGVRAIPALFILDQNGLLQYHIQGYGPEDEFMPMVRSRIKALLRKQ